MHSDRVNQPTGHFILEVRRKGLIVPELCMDEPNLIVNGSKLVHSRMLAGDVTGRSVAQIGYGTSGTAPAAGNTALTGAFTKAIDSHSYPDAASVQFSFSLASGEDNGMAILEFGLICTDGTLYARKIRTTPLNKDVDLSLSGTWTINF